jgi:protein-L-isoaspartate(D-aspartate) O-methyltransferase
MKVGNGYEGWKENAPYDRIIVTAMPDYIPESLVNQLKDGGKMIIPVQGDLILVTKTGDSYTEQKLIGVRFVPLVE